MKSLDSKGSVAGGGAQVEDQITEIAVDGGVEVGATSGEEKEPIVNRQNTATGRLEGCWNLELTAFPRMPEIYSRLPNSLILI